MKNESELKARKLELISRKKLHIDKVKAYYQCELNVQAQLCVDLYITATGRKESFRLGDDRIIPFKYFNGALTCIYPESHGLKIYLNNWVFTRGESGMLCLGLKPQSFGQDAMVEVKISMGTTAQWKHVKNEILVPTRLGMKKIDAYDYAKILF